MVRAGLKLRWRPGAEAFTDVLVPQGARETLSFTATDFHELARDLFTHLSGPPPEGAVEMPQFENYAAFQAKVYQVADSPEDIKEFYEASMEGWDELVLGAFGQCGLEGQAIYGPSMWGGCGRRTAGGRLFRLKPAESEEGA
jgi:hypothetical protein